MSQLQDRLASAIYGGDFPTVVSVLRDGANPNDCDWNGWTPLMQAAEEERLDVVELLLQWGADPNRRGFKGQTALHIAVDIAIDGTHQSRRSPDEEPVHIVKALMRAGALTDIPDDNGRTPLDWARRYGSVRLTTALLGQL